MKERILCYTTDVSSRQLFKRHLHHKISHYGHAGWNVASNQEEDSPSTGNNGPEQSPAKPSAEKPDSSPSSEMNSLAPGETDDAPMEQAPKGASALEAPMELSPLPDSPTGLAPVRLDNEVHVGASDEAPPQHGW